jgi:hypothetical protein
MAKKILKEPLEQLLGKAAYDNRGVVPDNVMNMFRSLYYLEGQIDIIVSIEDKQERKEYLEKIMESTAEMLNTTHEK